MRRSTLLHPVVGAGVKVGLTGSGAVIVEGRPACVLYVSGKTMGVEDVEDEEDEQELEWLVDCVLLVECVVTLVVVCVDVARVVEVY